MNTTRRSFLAFGTLACVVGTRPLCAANREQLIISGASGQLGELAVDELLRRGADPRHLILVSHTPDKLAAYARRGASVRYGDLFKPETLAAAYAGGTRMLLISVGVIPGSPPRPAAHRAGFEAAVRAGVRHIAYTSFLGADQGDSVIATEHRLSEVDLRASGARWTALRNGMYADRVVPAALQMAKTGRTTVSAGEQKSAYVLRADCAAAAAGALLQPSLSENRVFDITGPELYDMRDVARSVGTLIGKNIEIEERLSAGGPGGGSPLTTPATVSDAVTLLAGRPAKGLTAILDANREQILAAAGVR